MIVVADRNNGFHHLWIGCTLLLMNHIVAQVTGFLEEFVGEADLKEKAKTDTKNTVMN